MFSSGFSRQTWFWRATGDVRGRANDPSSAHPYEEPAYEVLKLENF